MSGDLAIKVTDVSKKYTLKHPKIGANGEETREHWALNSISFEVKKGESVGIIGPNGSGKSTLLKILSGITKPTTGEVEIRGRVASILDIGAGFHPELSGRENVFLNGQLLGFSNEEIKLKYNEIVEFSGINNFIDEPVKTYSNGMYLRLAFSILAHLDFDIYLFDEVMSVGDARFQIKVKHYLEKKQKEKASTFVFVSHQLVEIQNSCNHIFLLEDGIITNDNQHELISKYLTHSYDEVDTNLPTNESAFVGNELKENDFCNLQRVFVLNEDTKTVFCAELTVEKLCNIDVSFSVEGLVGNELLYLSTLSGQTLSLSANRHLVSVNFPSHVLVSGKYVLCITILVNKITVVNRLKSCTFILPKTGNKLLDERPNVPIANSNWITSYLT